MPSVAVAVVPVSEPTVSAVPPRSNAPSLASRVMPVVGPVSAMTPLGALLTGPASTPAAWTPPVLVSPPVRLPVVTRVPALTNGAETVVKVPVLIRVPPGALTASAV
ncbi:hypothetical protein JHFBIEKO_5624 [Methylobacterium mesophilicum]|nr:hypothetical protein JHFBIEKO_5624 [Methylobacterium mesophilicum]